jgi:hypothetical protein
LKVDYYLGSNTLESQRDHIFISYAWEDVALAEWLARKLLATGYAVWLDRFKILGGNIWPDDIDDAIKNRTFRMVHLLSKYSLEKENPKKERQLALTISKERNENFLIPLNVDGLTPQELPWQLSDIQYIPFDNWAKGFQQLIKTLDAAGCPRPLASTGQDLAIKSYFPVKAIKEEPEGLYTNCYKVLHVPKLIQKWKSTRSFSWKDAQRISVSQWPCYRINDNVLLAFDPPPQGLQEGYQFYLDGEALWSTDERIEGVRSHNVVKSLVRKAFSCVAMSKGLRFHENGKYWYFTPTTLEGWQNIHFRDHNGRNTYIKAYGERKIWSEIVKYYLAFGIDIRDDILGSLTFQIKIRLHLQESNGLDLNSRKVPSLRKAIVGNWWNHEWFLRQQAIISFLAENQETFSWGDTIRFSAIPYYAEIPFSLDDEYIDSLKVVGKSETEIKKEILENEIEEDFEG